jgi:hypothetical protein
MHARAARRVVHPQLEHLIVPGVQARAAGLIVFAAMGAQGANRMHRYEQVHDCDMSRDFRKQKSPGSPGRSEA